MANNIIMKSPTTPDWFIEAYYDRTSFVLEFYCGAGADPKRVLFGKKSAKAIAEWLTIGGKGENYKLLLPHDEELNLTKERNTRLWLRLARGGSCTIAKSDTNNLYHMLNEFIGNR